MGPSPRFATALDQGGCLPVPIYESHKFKFVNAVSSKLVPNFEAIYLMPTLEANPPEPFLEKEELAVSLDFSSP